MKRTGWMAFAVIITICVVFTQGIAFAGQTVVTEKQKNQLQQEIFEHLKMVYGDRYRVENEQWELTSAETEDGAVTAEFLMTADVTLVNNAYSMPYYQGLYGLWQKASAQEEKAKLLVMMEAYVSELHAIYYNIPLQESFEFAVRVPVENLQRETGALAGEIYYKGLAGLYPLESLLLDEEVSKALAQEAAQAYLQAETGATLPYSQQSVGYNRRAARRYAREQFYSPEHYGKYESNCANFISYCLSEGGGLARTSRWRPGQYDWIRTGYNKANGITLHVVRHAGFQNTDNRAAVAAGAIVMWQDFSHVGLITYGDGTKLRFTAHTTYRQDFLVSAAEAVTFYQR